MAKYTPKAIFDNAENLVKKILPQHIPKQFINDYKQTSLFLISYQHNAQTFKSFRRDVERFVQWAWFIANKSIIDIQRTDIEDYLAFCQKPPVTWVGQKNVARFTTQDGERLPNPPWRPFVATLTKLDRQKEKEVKREKYHLSEKGFREIFTVLNCFYNFLIQDGATQINPILQIKQKNRFYRKQQSKPKIRRISDLQWQFVIETAENMAAREPDKHERTLFIISMLYGLYLRISELTATDRWIPQMNDFEEDHEGNWWFTTIGKGNKERQISVSNSMLAALKRWRKHLKLSPALPPPNDTSPLIPKCIGHGPVTDTRHVRRIVQTCFDEAIKKAREEGFEKDADSLEQATVHWLRHTGISDDVKTRPREHVRDDAGHSSGAITDKYIDINLQERHASAKNKLINKDKSIAQPFEDDHKI